ncbi:Mbeg1-like protein [uncultured Pseudoramibacter sp.]|uniref:Mbeg1-like protein n=1 Tax=uncultured Pseudoramibacter sp. TaxID=1623493 RepID=UPI0025CD8437|nr:Mbeg1-like protein [uncultured Pseudoramibacter sp.]
MGNVFDYLKWRGDIPMEVDGFNAVDNLIFSELVYVDLEKAVPESWDPGVTIAEAAARYQAAEDPEQAAVFSVYKRKSVALLAASAGTRRFRDVKMHAFISRVSHSAEGQMAAVTFEMPHHRYYTAFRGTDDSFVGWKEDFNISYLAETEGQRQSAAYLNRHFVGRRGTLMTGGHSKGGNFAVYAAAMAAPGVRERIHRIYNNDGPGFREAFVSRAGYLSVRDKIVSIIPAGSVIGVLLANVPPHAVVASDAQGIVQHDGFSWQVLGTDFVPGARTALSLYIEDTLSRWIEGESDADRRHFVDGLFDIFNEGLDQMDDLSNKRLVSLAKCVRALKNLPLDERQQFIKVTLDLLRQGGAVAGEKSETWLKGIEEKLPEIKLSLPDKLKKL